MKQTDATKTLLGTLVLNENTNTALPLQKTLISGHISGLVMILHITQEFSNPFPNEVELLYLFPLPHKAAITDFEIRTSRRVIVSEVREREEAEQVYQSAIKNKKLAGMLEQRRPNLFAVKIGNVQPGETIQTSIRLHDRVKFLDGSFEVVLPMGLTPRYHTADNPNEKIDTDIQLASPGEKIGSLELDLFIDGGVPVGDPSSPSHHLVLTRLDKRRFKLTLAGENIPNKDFVLRYPLVSTHPQGWSWYSHGEESDTMLAILLPPALPDDFEAPARDFIFVLDRSGSMSGEPIAQARNALRACLRSLNPTDTFRILLFDDMTEWYKHGASPATQEEIDQADAFLGQVEGRGGTEILSALEQTLRINEDSARVRYIVFLTDGAVSAEERVLAKLRQQIGNNRVFTFGIGPSVNRALLEQIAASGRGQAEFLQLNEDIEGAVIRFQDRVSFPMLTDLTIRFEGAKSWDMYPALLPDLYAGQPVEICGHMLAGQSQIRVIISGKRAGQTMELALPLPVQTQKDESVEYIWAKARIDSLLSQLTSEPIDSEKLRTQVIGLAIKYKIITPYTAFVAVDSDTIDQLSGKPRLVEISQPLPEGLSRQGFAPVRAFSAMPTRIAGIFDTGAAAPPAAAIQDRRSDLSSSISNLDIPSFMRVRGQPQKKAAQPEREAEQAITLRSLARSQNMDGSWSDSIEETSAALLAFMRNGHTTQAGDFRAIVRRAARWLAEQTCAGLDAYLQAAAIHRLAQISGVESYKNRALALVNQLPVPSTLLEKSIKELIEGKDPEKISDLQNATTLDEIRLAGILGRKVEVDQKLLKMDQPESISTWLLCLG